MTVHERQRSFPTKSDPRVPGPPRGQRSVDITALSRDLRRALDGEVRFDAGSMALYANDASNFRQPPIGVVVPRTLQDVVETHRICARHGVPLVNRGAGTSLSGETVNYAVVLDHSKYLTDIGEVDADRRLVTCQTGVINEQLNLHTGPQGLVFGPDPSSHSRCAIGGNLGNNSCGVHSVQAQLFGPGPRTSDNTEALEIVTYDGERFWVGVGEEDQIDDIVAAGGRKGEIYAQLRALRDRYADQIRAGFPPVTEVPRRVSGYNLDELLPERGFNVARALVGTESTCATVLQAVLKLTPAMLARTLVVVRCPDAPAAADLCPEIIERWRPIGLEAVDHLLIEDEQQEKMNVSSLHILPGETGEQGAWLMVQFGSDDQQESEDRATRFRQWLVADRGFAPGDVVLAASQAAGGQSEQLWSIREGGLGATAFPPDERDHWPGWEDSAVPPDRLGDYLRELQKLYDRHALRGAMYGHFGQGCVHSRISFDLRTAAGIADYRRFMEEAADLVTSFGGSLSGEHGDGQQRAELLEKQYGADLVRAMREFKAIWDPRGLMSPGKVVDAYPFDEDLRLGVDYNPPRPDTAFSFAEDGYDFAHAALRCVGVGKCRVPETEQVMCPSYMVTREEKHSTRGRARLLFEMLQGEVITDGWQSTEVAEALDLCLACKGCTNDCPVNVDMPTYKAEFLHHHYQSLRRWRPRSAYAMGFIDQAARLACRIPEISNTVTHLPGTAHLVRWMGGVTQHRPVPRFAPMTLQQWFKERGGTTNPDGPAVVLFPDTFNNHFHTDVGVACVEAIEAAGWQVVMPEGHLCCGRPLYDYGFLDVAQRYLHSVLDALREEVRAGTPVVGMEPSCLAVFKDELVKIFPHDDDARRLAGNAYHFAEFFSAFEIEPPALAEGTEALLWGHCHHKATGGMTPEEDLLRTMGAAVTQPKGGCCGLAGSWGFEAGKYDISLECGEQALLPAVRNADRTTWIVADGFSCRTQIQDARTGRRAIHVAQLMKLAREGQDPLSAAAAERGPLTRRPAPATARRVARSALAIGGAAAAALAGWSLIGGGPRKST